MHKWKYKVYCRSSWYKKRNSYIRIGKKDLYSNSELVAKTNEEVELHDAIDSLSDEETTQLVYIAKKGGLILREGLNQQEVTDFLYLEIDLGHYLHKGLIVV